MFDPKTASDKLHQALKINSNNNKETIIEISTSHTNSQRLKIREEYKNQFGIDLIEDLKSEISGHLKDALISMYYHPIDLDCLTLRSAMKGLGTDEDALIEILATRPPEVIEQIKERYSEMYPGRTLLKDIEDDTSGNFKSILTALIEAKRPSNSNPDLAECEKCAKLLQDATEQKKKDVEIFSKIFTEKSQAEFICIAQLYFKLTKKTILQVVEKEFSGDSKEALIGIIYAMLSPSEYFAKKVYKSIKGLGTDNNTLIRILITRNEKDMPQIKQFYKQIYKKDMIEGIKDDTSGSYRKILVELATH